MTAIKHINSLHLSSNIEDSMPCEICFMARQDKPPFPRSSITTKHCLDIIHIDTLGTYKTPTYKEDKYYLIIVDDFFRSTLASLLCAKSNAFPTLKAFLQYVERQFSTKVKFIRSDNAFKLGFGNLAT